MFKFEVTVGDEFTLLKSALPPCSVVIMVDFSYVNLTSGRGPL